LVGLTGFSKEAEGEMVRDDVRVELTERDLGGSDVNLGKTTESSLEMAPGVGVEVLEEGLGVDVFELDEV